MLSHLLLIYYRLGAGTGLVGIAAAATWKCEVLLTDLPYIEVNLAYNVSKNVGIVESIGGRMATSVLDWKVGNIISSSDVNDQYDVGHYISKTPFGAVLIFKGRHCC